MTMHTRLLAALAVAALCMGVIFGTGAYLHHRQEAARLQKAQQLDQSQATHGQEAITHEQAAQALTPVLGQDTTTDASDDAQVAQDRAALARLRAAHPRPDPAPVPGADAPQPVSAPVELAAVDAATEKLVSDLTQEVADRKKHEADLQLALDAMTAGDQARQAQVKDLQGEVGQLRAIIAARPTVRTMTVGAVYGTNQTVGGYFSKDLGPVQIGVELVRRQLAGGQTSLEAIGYGGVRF